MSATRSGVHGGVVAESLRPGPQRREPRGSTFGYIGWDRHGNMGDDAIRESIEISFPDQRLVRLPLDSHDLLDPAMLKSLLGVRGMRLFLGGGTAIGRRNWRRPIQRNLAVCGIQPALMLGAGVEDPVFGGKDSFSDNDELKAWRNVLRKFDKVTVRGPRSAELLADIGVDAVVVGDPALLLEAAPADTIEGLIGVNLGFGSDLWSQDQQRVADSVGAAMSKLHGDGHRFRLLVVNPEDLVWSERCLAAANIPDGAYDIVNGLSSQTYFEGVASCELLIAERLHAGILGAAAGVPVIMLEYQPKCLDFMRSVGQERWSIRTDQISASRLHAEVLALRGMIAGQRLGLKAEVRARRSALQAEVRHIAGLLRQ